MAATQLIDIVLFIKKKRDWIQWAFTPSFS
jgi:hypothetical protein